MTTVHVGSSDLFTAPPSFAQQRMWLLEQLEDNASVYNVQAGFRFRGRFDRGVLQRALDEIVARHEVLRTRLVNTGDGLVQRIHPPESVVLDYADIGSADPDGALRRLAAVEARRPFDLSTEPPLRALLARTAADHHLFVVTLDHLVCDARSLDVMHQELCALYAAFQGGEPSPLPEPVIQYADYAAWQRDWMAGPELRRQLDYWAERMQPPPPRLDLPATRGRRRSVATATTVQELPSELIDQMRELAAGERASLFSALLAAFAVVLARAGGETDMVFGNLLEGRTQSEIESLIGFFVNTVALRADLSGDPTFRELLRRVRNVTLDAYAHQDLPFDRLVEELQPEREAGRQPWFDVMFQLVEVDRAAVSFPGGVIEPLRMDFLPAPIDLVLGVLHEGNTYRAEWDYNQGLLSSAVIERMQAHFHNVLTAVVRDADLRLSRIPLLDTAERTKVLGWAGERRSTPGRLIHQEFTACVQERPDGIAAVAGERTATYRDLDRRSRTLAARLRATGVGAGSPVGIFLRRGLDSLASVLAVLRAGGAFMPLDPAYPAERLRLMVEDAAPVAILTDSTLQPTLPGRVNVIRVDDPEGDAAAVEPLPPPEIGPDDAAYIIYTSGSTGRPKGTVVTHGGAAVILQAQRDCFGLGSQDRILQYASPSFDASVFELLLAVGSAGTLVLAPPDGVDPADLAPFLTAHAVTMVVLPPAALALMPAQHDLPTLHTITTAGEACPPALAARWRTGRRFFNLYGPTETTIWATAHEAGPADAAIPTLSIGKPVSGATAYVLDRNLGLAPVGVPGELVIGGGTLARGYIDRPGLTADRFVPDPFASRPGSRMYRTGDLAQWRENGTLEFLGRIDTQVKLHGFRIEPGEVESRLAAHPDVLDAAVLVREDTPGHRILAAYVVTRREVAHTILRDHCAATLPAFMVPGAFVSLNALPLGPNGKVDQRALPIPAADTEPESEEHVAPRTELEKLVAEIWGEVLGRADVGAHDNFFALGGHSLAASRVITRFRADFDVQVPVRTIFESPVLADFVEALAGLIGTTAEKEAR